ncbi:TPA: hypothetical protein I9Y23_001321 [Kluyvera ascorbata]|uniref:Uncharacterized protein n=1 Tax=Kluyvera genomosp. 2 TaxID=2774054 RepID=A0A2T2Y781_9ENTR|nr:hypothetical protein [Kluyvera genomosp. 2]PSR48393.1 hypothetical protein C8256_04495 [Kluyvera genomosp. 2]HAT3917707.1 hypothetical protein [Kluyvera ascorbata]HAT3942620.1 hypothetical protein [Kluyvera ascorbata]HAT3946984.1 hypothetical protein [Kluyvera ascorbata]
MDILSFLLGLLAALAIIGIAFYWLKKIHTKRKLKQYRSNGLDSSLKDAKTLLNAADHLNAIDNNAIGAIWRARQCSEHASKNGEVYAIKGSWALKKKMMKVGPSGYLNDIPLPRSCGCYLTYIYNLRSLPDNMLTANTNKILKK